MFPIKKIAKKREHVLVDKRIWWMIMGVGFLGYIVMKEISLPPAVVLVFGVIGMLGLLIVGLQNPEVPLYALIAYIPFSRILVGDFATQATAFNMTNILCLWVFLAHMMRQMSLGQPITQGTVLNRVILFYCLMGAAALMRASFTYGSWYGGAYLISLKRWLTPMLFYFLALWAVRDRRVLKTCVVLIMASITIVAIMSIRDYMYVSGSGFEKSRVGGIVDHSNTLGAFFVYYMFLFLGFFFVFPKNKLKVWLLLIPFLLCFRGIMVTFSRGAYIAFAFATLGLLWFRNKLMFMAAMAIIVLMVANPMFMPSGIRYRFSGTVEQSQADVSYIDVPLEETLEVSAATRVRIWKGAAQMIKEHPWWGVGYGAFPGFIPRYTQGQNIGLMDAHNSYILIAAEMGIPTLLIFLMILIVATYYTHWLYRNAKDPSMKAIALGFLGGLAGLAVANMFGSRMDSQQAAGYFWVLCGLIMRGVVLERRDMKAGTAGK